MILLRARKSPETWSNPLCWSFLSSSEDFLLLHPALRGRRSCFPSLRETHSNFRECNFWENGVIDECPSHLQWKENFNQRRGGKLPARSADVQKLHKVTRRYDFFNLSFNSRLLEDQPMLRQKERRIWCQELVWWAWSNSFLFRLFSFKTTAELNSAQFHMLLHFDSRSAIFSEWTDDTSFLNSYSFWASHSLR